MDRFQKALRNLEKGYELGQERELDVLRRTGLVGLFEICFEQAWKTMKSVLYRQRFLEAWSGRPATVIKLAYREGMINDEELWRDMLDDRSRGVHTYDEESTDEIIAALSEYIGAFRQLQTELGTRWRAESPSRHFNAEKVTFGLQSFHDACNDVECFHREVFRRSFNI